MFSKSCWMLVVCAAVVTVAPSAYAGIYLIPVNPPAVNPVDTPPELDIMWGWNPVEEDAFHYDTPQAVNWRTYLHIMEATPGGDWNVMWEFQHLIPPDACGLGPAFASPVVTFPRNATGVVISTGGSIQHTAHLDTWQFQFVRDIANPANNRIYLNVWHPEPTTLALLAVGSLVLFRRR